MLPLPSVLRWRPGAERRDLIWFALLALLVLGVGLGLREPWPADEPRFALVGYDMARHGDWLFPRVAGVLYPDKPPLFMWLIGAGYLLTGSLGVAFLLPSLLAGLGMLWLTYDLGRRLWGHRAGLAGAALLLCTVQFALQARTAQIDALVAFLVTLGFYGLARHLLLGPAWGWYALGGFAAGLGIITKGVGFLALFALVPWAFAAWRGWPRVAPPPAGGGDAARLALAPLLMCAAVALWLVPMLLAVGASADAAHLAYRDEILFRQTGERYAAAWHHHQPAWYYLVEVIPPFWLPLSLLLPWLLPAWWRRLARRDARLLLPLGTALLVLLFFTASPGKRGVYVLPMLPLVALAAAPLLAALLRRAAVQRLGTVALALASVALLAFPQLPQYHALAARHELDAAAFFYALGATGVAWLAWGRLARGMYAFAGFLASLWLVYGALGHPLLDPVRSARALMAEVRAAVPIGAELGLVDWEEQFVLQAGRPIVHFGFRRKGRRDELDDALRWQAAAPGRWLMLPEPKDGACIIAARATDLGYRSRRHWLAVGPDAVSDACRARASAAGPPAVAIAWSPGADRSEP